MSAADLLISLWAEPRDNQVAALYNYNLARMELATATGNIAEYVNQ